jgi:hypothetical protein
MEVAAGVPHGPVTRTDRLSWTDRVPGATGAPDAAGVALGPDRVCRADRLYQTTR